MRRTGWLVVMVSTLVFAHTALAARPCLCDAGWSLPRSGTVDVPLNTRFLVSWPGADLEQIALYRVDGENIIREAATTTPASDLEEQLWVVPDAELEPRREYVLEAPIVGAGNTFTIVVRTGSERHEGEPASEIFSVIPEAVPGACEDHVAGRLVSENPSDLRVIEITLERDEGTHAILVHESYPWMGDGSPGGASWAGCLRSLPGAEPDRVYAATAVVIDIAGQRSAPSALDVQLGFHPFVPEDCSCQILAAPAAPDLGWIHGLALLVLWVLRRPFLP